MRDLADLCAFHVDDIAAITEDADERHCARNDICSDFVAEIKIVSGEKQSYGSLCGAGTTMPSRKRDFHFLLFIKKLSTTKPLQPLAMETWLVLVLIVVMLLTVIAMGTWFDSFHTNRTDWPYQHFEHEFVC